MKNNRRYFIKKSAGIAAATMAVASVSGLTGCSVTDGNVNLITLL